MYKERECVCKMTVYHTNGHVNLNTMTASLGNQEFVSEQPVSRVFYC